MTPVYIGALGELSLPLTMMATRVCAGFPSPADDFAEGELDILDLLAPNRPATFMWRVNGMSVIEAGIHDGDIIVVDRSVKPKNDQVVLVYIDGEASLKVYRRGGLAFANSDYPAYEVRDGAHVEIWGTVTWNLHQPSL